MKKTRRLFFLLTVVFTLSCSHYNTVSENKHRVVWQPSHQTDTGKDFSEAAVCNAIVEAAMAAEPDLKEFKENTHILEQIEKDIW